jgi:hypothetical protein
LQIWAGLMVTMATSSSGENRSPASWLARRATFSSPIRFLLPDGAQSDPRPISTPDPFNASRSAVAPYSR